VLQPTEMTADAIAVVPSANEFSMRREFIPHFFIHISQPFVGCFPSIYCAVFCYVYCPHLLGIKKKNKNKNLIKIIIIIGEGVLTLLVAGSNLCQQSGSRHCRRLIYFVCVDFTGPIRTPISRFPLKNWNSRHYRD